MQTLSYCAFSPVLTARNGGLVVIQWHCGRWPRSGEPASRWNCRLADGHPRPTTWTPDNEWRARGLLEQSYERVAEVQGVVLYRRR
jgi:hypothetical protein